jgi:FAD/FMN-containing dehydrogenase
VPAGTGGVVLSTEAMQAIKLIDADDRIAVVEPGVINGDLQQAVEARICSTRRTPPAWRCVRWAATSPRTRAGRAPFKYGVTRDWTLGMTVTLMGGRR